MLMNAMLWIWHSYISSAAHIVLLETATVEIIGRNNRQASNPNKNFGKHKMFENYSWLSIYISIYKWYLNNYMQKEQCGEECIPDYSDVLKAFPLLKFWDCKMWQSRIYLHWLKETKWGLVINIIIKIYNIVSFSDCKVFFWGSFENHPLPRLKICRLSWQFKQKQISSIQRMFYDQVMSITIQTKKFSAKCFWISKSPSCK